MQKQPDNRIPSDDTPTPAIDAAVRDLDTALDARRIARIVAGEMRG